MTAGDHTAGFGDDLGRRGEDGADGLDRKPLGECGDVERDLHPATHREDVAAGVGGRDRAEVGRIVDQRREEVGGRDEGEVVSEGEHGGVVERRQPDEEPGRIGGRAGRWPARDGAQQPGQRSGAPLRRASAARRPLRELHIHETQYSRDSS